MGADRSGASERPEGSGFVSHVEGSAGMPEYPTPEAMAVACGGPVHVATVWPGGVEPQYGVETPAAGSSHQYRSYRTWWRVGARLQGLVIGSVARYPQQDGMAGWTPVPELAAVEGITDGGTVLVDVEGHSLMFLMFPSFEDAVAAAGSLRRIDPPVAS